LTDVTDARQIAQQLSWAATAKSARDEPFNIVNGDIFRWKWLWPQLAAFFGLESAPYPGHPTPLEEQMRGFGPVWTTIVAREGLIEADLERLASPWHTDMDLGREIECVTLSTRIRATPSLICSSASKWSESFLRLLNEDLPAFIKA